MGSKSGSFGVQYGLYCKSKEPLLESNLDYTVILLIINKLQIVGKRGEGRVCMLLHYHNPLQGFGFRQHFNGKALDKLILRNDGYAELFGLSILARCAFHIVVDEEGGSLRN